MKDPVTVTRVNALHPLIITQFTGFIDDIEALTGRIWRMVQGGRSFAEQDALYAQGRAKPGRIVTYSPGGTSYHNYWLAGDMAPFVLNSLTQLDWSFDYKKIRDVAIAHGLQCGMDFLHPDEDHFEDKKGLNWRDMLHKYTIKDFIPGTTFINIP
jgi:peptidoglycan LD-endopeptidase CwlK